MKEKILKNWGFKILAVFLGFFLWFLVANIEDYSVTKTITGIPVELLNEEAIIEQGMVYEIEQGETVDIKVQGCRSVVEGLTVDDFVASADLSEMSITNSVQITVEAISATVRREVDITIVDSTMKVAIEESGEQKLPVTIITTGNPEDGYAVISTSATPNMVTITGAASAVKRVAAVQAEVDVEGLNTGISTRSTLVLLDSDGEIIESDRIETNISTVTVQVVIQKTKEVPIEVSTIGDVADGYGIAGEIEYQPATVLIAGEESDLRGISAIRIDDIDVTDMDSDYETTVNIEDYLPDGVVVADGTQRIAVKVTIEQLVEKTLTIHASNISITGKSDDFTYTLASEDNQFEITVIGLQADVDALSVADFDPVIDVSELQTEGTYAVAVQLNALDNLQYSADFTATVMVEEKDVTTEAASEESDTEASTEAGTAE